MIERLLPGSTGKYQAGIYAQGYRILDAANMFAFLFATLLLPIFSRMLKHKENVVDLVRTSYPLFFFPSFILVASCFFYRAEIMELLYHQTSAYHYKIFGGLMINLLAIGSVYIFGTLLTANGNLKFLNLISLTGVILNIVLNLILIRKYQAFGAVISTLITQFLMSFLQIIKAVSIFKIKTSWTYLMKSLLFILLVPLMYYLLKNNINNWMIGIFVGAFISFLFILLLKLLKFRNLFNELKQGRLPVD